MHVAHCGTADLSSVFGTLPIFFIHPVMAASTLLMPLERFFEEFEDEIDQKERLGGGVSSDCRPIR